MKRPCEDSSSAGSDAEEPIDVGSESLYPGHVKASFITRGSPTTTTQTMARKKRRGIIEKRRRDRINNSLLELRRLVPSAFEKQGSAKLEKAEILQMTVDHLKLLQAAGGKGYLDAHALALDFLSLGFRECVTEVSRYLSAVEGLDAGDPLRCRLLAHLASCAAQRDAAAALVVSSPPPHPLQPRPFPHPFHPHQWAAVAAFRPAAYGLPLSPEAGGGGGGGGGGAPQRPVELASSLPDSSSSSSSVVPPLLSFPLALHAGFPILPPSSSFTCTASPPISSSSSSSSSSLTPRKPYRPWGTEVGAF